MAIEGTIVFCPYQKTLFNHVIAPKGKKVVWELKHLNDRDNLNNPECVGYHFVDDIVILKRCIEEGNNDNVQS